MSPGAQGVPGLFDLGTRTVLVTGSGRGIGAALADAFEAAGALVYRHVRDEASVPAGLAPDQASRVVVADLAAPNALDLLVAGLAGAEVIDVLVNNAAVEPAEDSTHLDASTWTETMVVNAFVPAASVGALLPKLQRSDGASVVNVTSTHEHFPYPGHLAYAASKAALTMATRTLAVALAPQGIRVNSLAPGIIETAINSDVFDRLGRTTFERAVPMRRVGTPADLVGPALFLASPAAAYVTGTTLFVDGGYTANLARYDTETAA